MIHHRHPFSVLVALSVGVLSACSSANQVGTTSSDADADAAPTAGEPIEGGVASGATDDNQVDEPQWVNASFLTCAWDSVEDGQVAFRCTVFKAPGVQATPDNPLSWAAKNAVTGATVQAVMIPIDALATEFKVLVVASVVPDLVMVMSSTGTAAFDLKPALPGLVPDSPLGPCLSGSTTPLDCFAAANVPIQGSSSSTGTATPTPLPTPTASPDDRR